MNEITEGSGNVFADMGLANPRERQAKAMLALHIEHLISINGWTQTEAAKQMGVTQPEVSQIINGRLKGFTLDRLFACLDALGQQVEIGIAPRIREDDSERVLVLY